jgi:hypothetical protein
MSEEVFHDPEQVREEIEDRLMLLAAEVGPEETLAYVERLAERMKEELDE